jgi:hypothetical protein
MIVRIAKTTLLLLIAAAAMATVVKPMSVEELTAKSSVVLVGQATQTWTAWNPQHTRIYTYSRVKASSALKGAQPDTVVVKQIGGSADGYTQHIAGVQAMRTGEKAVLFLRLSEARDGTYVIVGLMQGHFRIARDSATGQTVVSNGVMGAEEISGQTVKSYRGARLSLSEMESRVRKAATRAE